MLKSWLDLAKLNQKLDINETRIRLYKAYEDKRLIFKLLKEVLMKER